MIFIYSAELRKFILDYNFDFFDEKNVYFLPKEKIVIILDKAKEIGLMTKDGFYYTSVGCLFKIAGFKAKPCSKDKRCKYYGGYIFKEA